MEKNQLEVIEIDLLLDAIHQRYGYDFKSYARASIERRIKHYLALSGMANISELIPKLLHDEHLFQDLVRKFSITTTEMFRDPSVYRAIRERVIPLLKTYPFIKIWHAGCATGEEVYSLAILLDEEGLLDRTTIFGTDFNDEALGVAKEGIYQLGKMQEFTKNYQNAGGLKSFSEYYHADFQVAAMDRRLKRQITFANHNLATDGVFSEIHLIMCRNVLIYFNQSLKDRVCRLFGESLIHGGLLCLGAKEIVAWPSESVGFAAVDESNGIYQKRLIGLR